MVDPGAFMMNAEAYRNWMGDALKKTRDAAVAIVKAAYGHAPVNPISSVDRREVARACLSPDGGPATGTAWSHSIRRATACC